MRRRSPRVWAFRRTASGDVAQRPDSQTGRHSLNDCRAGASEGQPGHVKVYLTRPMVARYFQGRLLCRDERCLESTTFASLLVLRQVRKTGCEAFGWTESLHLRRLCRRLQHNLGRGPGRIRGLGHNDRRPALKRAQPMQRISRRNARRAPNASRHLAPALRELGRDRFGFGHLAASCLGAILLTQLNATNASRHQPVNRRG